MLHELDNLVNECIEEQVNSHRTTSQRDSKDVVNAVQKKKAEDESRIMNLDIQVLTHYFRDNFFYFYAQKGTIDLGY